MAQVNQPRKRPRAKASLLDLGLRIADSLGLEQSKRGALLDLTEELESRLLELTEAATGVASATDETEASAPAKKTTQQGTSIPSGFQTRATGGTTTGWNFRAPIPSDPDGTYQEFEAVVAAGEAIDVGCALNVYGDRVKLARVATIMDEDRWCNAVATKVIPGGKVRYRCGGTLLVKKKSSSINSGTVFLSSAGFFTDDPNEVVVDREIYQALGTWREYVRKPTELGGGDAGFGYACFSFSPPINALWNVVTVGDSGADFTTWQAAVDHVKALGDCSSTKPYAILGYPGLYLESVIVDVPYLTLVGLGGPEATIIRNDDNCDAGGWDCPITITASNVTLDGLGLRNLFTITGAIEATIALAIGGESSVAALSGIRVRHCVLRGTGRDAIFSRGAVTDTAIEDCDIVGYSHSPSVDAGPAPGSGKTTRVEFRRCELTTTVATAWIGMQATDISFVLFEDCDFIVSAGEPMFYLDGGGTSTITALNCRSITAGCYLYQTAPAHAGATTINHAGVIVDADRAGALVGTVTLVPMEQRATKVESLHSVTTVQADAAEGTAPLIVTSGTQVENLNSNDAGPQCGFKSYVDDINISAVGADLTLTPTDDVYYWIDGVRYPLLNGIDYDFDMSSVADGFHLVSFDVNGTSVSHTSLQSRLTNCIYAMFYKQGANYLWANERHTTVMDVATHAEHHNALGAMINAGGFACSFSTAGVNAGAGTLYDEDIQHRLTGANPQNVRVFSRSATPGIWQWTALQARFWFGTATTILYDDGDGTGASISNNDYGVMYVLASNFDNAGEPTLITIPGQADYANLTAARNASFADLTLGTLPTPETHLLYKVIIKQRAGSVSVTESQDLRNNGAVGTGVVSLTTHNSLSGRSDADCHPESSISTSIANNNFIESDGSKLADSGFSDASFVKQTLADAKGDLLAATAADAFARVAAGADGKSVVYDSSAAAGIAAAERERVLYITSSSSNTITNTASETDFNQSYTFAANALAVGQAYRVRFFGRCVDNTTAETLQIKVYLGANLILDTGARQTQNASSIIRGSVDFVVWSVGATGSVLVTNQEGYAVFYYTGIQIGILPAVNTTGTLTCKVAAKWSAANASATANLWTFMIERLV